MAYPLTRYGSDKLTKWARSLYFYVAEKKVWKGIDPRRPVNVCDNVEVPGRKDMSKNYWKVGSGAELLCGKRSFWCTSPLGHIGETCVFCGYETRFEEGTNE